MLELSAHILDIAENSVRAGAKLVEITIIENDSENLLSIEINDNGSGMTKEEITKALDPFYTTKKVRRIGLGLPMLSDAAERAGGNLNLDSTKGKGTNLKVTFQLDHIDRQPLGDIVGTIVILIAGNSDVDFLFKYRKNDWHFKLDTRDIRQEISDIPINHHEVLKYIRSVLDEGLC